MKHVCRFLVFALGAVLLPAPAFAQNDLTARCTGVPNDPGRRFCNLIAEAIEIGQARVGIVFTGGNPVPGAASTVGMRIGKLPRVAVGARLTGVGMDLPPLADFNGGSEIEDFLPSLNIDATVGIFEGIGLLPTVGGFASFDLIGSVGTVGISEDEGFSEGRVSSWALGARLGILRESFTAPGISVSGMYRRISGQSFGSQQLAPEDAFFDIEGLRVLSLRGVVGKRIVVLSALAGVGYDKYNSDVSFALNNPSLTGPSRFDFSVEDFSNDRLTAFGSLYYTVLVLSVVGEAGWQSGNDLGVPLPAGRTSLAEKGAFYGSLIVRVSF